MPRKARNSSRDLELALAALITANLRLYAAARASERPDLELVAMTIGSLVASVRSNSVQAGELQEIVKRIGEWETEGTPPASDW